MSQVRKIFEELQTKGLIDRDAKLIPSKGVPNFQKSLFRKTILFNPAFDNGILDENCIRLLLLHEWGHYIDKAFRRPISIVVGFILGVFLYPYFCLQYVVYPSIRAISFLSIINIYLFWCVGIIIVILSFLLIIWGTILLFTHIFKRWGHMDEHMADLWAAERICKIYGISPSSLLRKCLKIAENTRVKKSVGLIIDKLLLFGLPTHPSIEERVKFIRNKDKGWECKKGE